MAEIKSIIQYKRYLTVYGAVLFFIDILLLFFPLTNVFGFEYSFVNGIAVSVLAGLYVCNALKDIPPGGTNQFWKTVLPALAVLLLIPFLTITIGQLFTSYCSFVDGLQFYLILTAPAVIVGTGLAVISGYISNKRNRTIFLLLCTAVILIPAVEFYLNPQIFFYNPLFGYFPGTIYDEGLSVSGTLVLYRSLNILYFGGAAWFILHSFAAADKIKRWKTAVILSVPPILLLLLSPYFGFSGTRSTAENLLEKRIVTDHFEIYFSPDIKTETVKSIVLHHEYYYKELREFFHTSPDEKIVSYVFKDAKQKKRIIGSENADVAKPWLNQIYTIYDNYKRTLKHEIAHCFAGSFGTGIFKVAENINPALIEGAAVAADPLYGENHVDYLASAAYKNGYKIKVEELFDHLSFFKQNSGLSYIYSGSFINYLINTFGVERFKKFYSDTDFEQIYGDNAEVIAAGYYDFLNSLPAEGENHKADYYFGRKSIFYKECPRYVADRAEEGWTYYNNEDYTKALDVFNINLEVTDDFSSLTGKVNTLIKLDSTNYAAGFMEQKINEYFGTSYYYSLELTLGDVYTRNNDYSKADSVYKNLMFQRPNRLYYNLSNMRRELLYRDSLLKLYLNGNLFDKYIVLKEINQNGYYYSSIPSFISIARELDINYSIFLRQFNRALHVTDFSSSYAVYELSEYMLENMDFLKAKRAAALAARYRGDFNFSYILKENYKKSGWFHRRGPDLITKYFNTNADTR